MFSICIFEGDVHRAYGQIRYGGERWARERVKDDSEVWPELLTVMEKIKSMEAV